MRLLNDVGECQSAGEATGDALSVASLNYRDYGCGTIYPAGPFHPNENAVLRYALP